MRLLRPILDQLIYWRSLDLSNAGFWPIPVFVVCIALVAWIGMWALFIDVPLLVAYAYVFRFDRLLRPFG